MAGRGSAGSRRGSANPSRSANGSFASRARRAEEREARRLGRTAGSPLPPARPRLVPSRSVPSPRARARGRASPGARGRPSSSAAAEEEEEEEEEEEVDDDNYHPASALAPTDAKTSAAFAGLAALPALCRPKTCLGQGVLNLDRMGNREAFLA